MSRVSALLRAPRNASARYVRDKARHYVVPHAPRGFAAVQDAVAELRRGRPVVVVDDEDRENEGDLVLAAEHATTEWMSFFVRHTSGVVCCALTAERARALRLPPMVARNEDAHQTAFTVSVDAVGDGATTGISARDRAATCRALADPGADAGAFRRPGHVFPLVARGGGVLERRGHTEAAVDLCLLANLAPCGVLSELVSEDASDMLRGDGLRWFAHRHGLAIITIEAIAASHADRLRAGHI